MSDPTQIGPGSKGPCPDCGEDYGTHSTKCGSYKRQKMVGVPVSREYVAKELGFASVEELDKWAEAERFKSQVQP